METFRRPWPVEHSPTSTDRASLVLVTGCLASLPAGFAGAATLPFHLAHSAWRQSQHSVMAGTKPGNWDPDWIRRQRDWNHLSVVTFLFKFWSISFQSYVLHTETHSCNLTVCTTLCRLVTAFSTLKILPKESYLNITIGHQMRITQCWIFKVLVIWPFLTM